MPFLPTISTFFIFVSAVLVAIGWRLIVKGEEKAHKKTMIYTAISALLLYITYISRTNFIGSTCFCGPDEFKIYYTIYLVFNITETTIRKIYISRNVLIGNTSFGGPDELKIYYTIFLIFHITLASIGAIFGIVTLVLAFKRKITVHRKIGPITSVIWFFSAGTGIMVYLLL